MMDMNELAIQSVNPSFVKEVQSLCHGYGLYGNVIYHNPSPFAESDCNRVFVVAGYDPEIEQDPLPPNLQPDDIIRRNERNKKVFCPGSWAYDLSENSDSMQAIQELDNYCSMAAFVQEIYAGYDLPAPEKIRFSRLSQLNDFVKGLNNPKVNSAARDKYQEGLDWYFKKEKSHTPLQKQWNDYFLSDRFPDDEGPIGRIMGFLNRKNNVISLEQLMDVNGDVNTLHMEEHEYQEFAKFMKDVYPDVLYAISEVEIVDHGIPKPSQRNTEAFGMLVTGEDFAVILKERFAEEGYEAIQNLKPMYWEYRDVHYKEIDEPLIARAYNSIRLAYAKPNDLMDLTERGPVCLKKIPYADFMNFVSLAKANNLRFYIDNRGEYAVPSLKTVNVLFNEYQKEKMHAITNRLMSEKGETARKYYTQEFSVPGKSLNSKIHAIEEQPKQPTKNNQINHSYDLRDN